MQLQQALAAQQLLIQAIQQEEQIDQHILDAFAHIPRHEFVLEFYECVPNTKHVAWRQARHHLQRSLRGQSTKEFSCFLSFAISLRIL